MTNAHARVKGLKCREEVYKRLGAGETFGRIAKYIEEQGEMLDIDHRSREAALRRFAEANPGLVLTKDPVQARALEILHGETPKYIQKWQDDFVERLDVLTEMEGLYCAQKTRIVRLMLAEQEVAEENPKYIMRELRAEVKLGFQMVKDVADLQMELQYLERAPIRIDQRTQKYEQTLDMKQIIVKFQTELLEELKERLPEDTVEELAQLQEDKLKELARLDLLEEMNKE